VKNKPNPEHTHLKLCLFTAQAYMERAIKDGLTKEPVHYRIVGGIESWKMLRRFSSAEHKAVVAIGEEKYMQKLKDQHISFVVYALQLLKRCAETYSFTIGVGKKHLLKGRGLFVVGMLDLKRRDNEKYKELKAIIDESVINANKFFDYTQEKLKETA